MFLSTNKAFQRHNTKRRILLIKMGAVITKDNQLVSNASYKMTHNEQLILLYALSTIDSKEALSDEDMISIDINQLAKADTAISNFTPTSKPHAHAYLSEK